MQRVACYRALSSWRRWHHPAATHFGIDDHTAITIVARRRSLPLLIAFAAKPATAAVSQSVTPITQLIWDPSAAAAQQAAGPVQPAAPGQEALKGCPQYQEVRSTSHGHAAAGSPDDLAITCQQSEQVRLLTSAGFHMY